MTLKRRLSFWFVCSTLTQVTKLGYKLGVLTVPETVAEAYFYEDRQGQSWIEEVFLNCDHIHIEKLDRNAVYIGVSTKEMAQTKFMLTGTKRGNIKITMYDDDIGLDIFRTEVYTKESE